MFYERLLTPRGEDVKIDFMGEKKYITSHHFTLLLTMLATTL